MGWDSEVVGRVEEGRVVRWTMRGSWIRMAVKAAMKAWSGDEECVRGDRYRTI